MRILDFAKRLKEYERYISKQVSDLLNEIDVNLNLTQVIILWNIAKGIGLGVRSNYERGGLSHNLDKLTNLGLLYKEGSVTNDRRRIRFGLTGKGQKVIDYLSDKITTKFIDRFIDNFIDEIKEG